MTKSNLLGFMIASIARNLSIKNPNEWEPKKAYSIGDLCLVGERKYCSMSNATSGFSAPSHQSGQRTDGGVMWQFIEAVNSSNPNSDMLYFAIGTTQTENSVDVLKGIRYAKRMTQSNIRLGKSYLPYEDNKNYSSGDIILNSDNKIYVCIVAGESVTQVEPTETSTENFKNYDGYVWRYISTISSSDENFKTSTSIPLNGVKHEILRGETARVNIINQSGDLSGTLKYDAKGALISYDVQPDGTIRRAWISRASYNHNANFVVAAKDSKALGNGATAVASIENGAINLLSVGVAGSGYNSATIFIHGDGSGAKANAIIDGIGSITGFELIDGGSGYTWADVYVIPGSAGALFEIEIEDISPKSILDNLDTNVLLINTSLYDIDGYLNENDNYNFVSLITNATRKALPNIAGPLNNNIQLHHLDDSSTILLWVSKFETKQRSAGQEENITVEIKLIE